MDIGLIREKSGLTESQFRRKLRPCLKKNHSLLTKEMLQKLEQGERLAEHRMNALTLSIQETFPEISDVHSITKPGRKRFKVSKHHIGLLIFIIISMLVIALYYFTGKKELINEVLTLVASVAGVLAFVFAIYKITSQ